MPIPNGSRAPNSAGMLLNGAGMLGWYTSAPFGAPLFCLQRYHCRTRLVELCRYIPEQCRYIPEQCRYIPEQCRYIPEQCRYIGLAHIGTVGGLPILYQVRNSTIAGRRSVLIHIITYDTAIWQQCISRLLGFISQLISSKAKGEQTTNMARLSAEMAIYFQTYGPDVCKDVVEIFPNVSSRYFQTCCRDFPEHVVNVFPNISSGH